MKLHSFLKIFSALLLSAVLLTGCGAPAESTGPSEPEASEQTEPAVTEPPASLKTIDDLLEQMTLRAKVGQLFIVRPDSLDPALTQEEINASGAAGVTELTDAMIEALQEYPVGGIVMFSKNLISPQQITAFNAALQDFSSIPLFLAVDEEGGVVARLANREGFDLPTYESAAAVGSSDDPGDAHSMGSAIGAYLSQYGFNMDFAPVADVNTNPNNPVIGARSFSSDAQTAAQMANAMAEGLNTHGITAVFKHFPGHGDTAEDSHSGIAVSHKTADEMLQCEWLPFLEAGSGDCVMVGHIAAPEITGDLTPATLSRQIVTDILKTQLHFQGLVITDSLAMGAITERYTPGEAAVQALNAGCDLLLMPNGLTEAFDAVLAAVEDGTYSEEAMNDTVRRILQFKLDRGILVLA